MTATLWLDTAKEKTVELGGSQQLAGAFGSMARACDNRLYLDWPDLSGVPFQVESQRDADPEWLADVRRQAMAFLAKYGDEITDYARWVLDQLKES